MKTLANYHIIGGAKLAAELMQSVQFAKVLNWPLNSNN
jgi:hypothetical protein